MLRTSIFGSTVAAAAGLISACSSAPDAAPQDAGVSLGDASFVDAAPPDASKPRVDGGFEGPDGGVIRADRFVTKVVSFTPGECAGFGAPNMPEVVLGPPVGAGELQGGLDVVSLGLGGEIVVSFEPNAIVDGPGPDFLVFENAFWAAGDPSQPAADPGEVSVSEDGETWLTFPCPAATAPPYGACAGWSPVYSAPGNGISAVDPAVAGGEAYDLAAVGLAQAKLVRIRDRSTTACPPEPPRPNTAGFDLDAVAIVHALVP